MFAAVLGTAVGLVHGMGIVASNDYYEMAPRFAGWVLLDAASSGMRQGVLWAIGVGAFVLLAWPVLRIFLGDWPRALRGACLAAPIVGLYLLAAWWVNRHVLPGALTAPSLAGNLALAGVALALWYALLRQLDRVELHSAFRAPMRLARPTTLLVVILAAVAVQSTRVIAKADPDPADPHVIVIVIDALRPDRLGSYGYHRDTSPNLDRFAAEAWLFKNAISTAPWTKPAIASLLTGLYPRAHGVSSSDWNLGEGDADVVAVSALSPRLVTLAEMLAENGYRTAAFGQNHHLIAELGFDQGFEVHDLEIWDQSFLRSLAQRLDLGVGRSEPRGERSNTAREINQRFLDWLPDGDDRFFAYLHHIDVHWPYRAPKPFAGRFGVRRTSVDFNSSEFYDQFGPERKQLDQPPGVDPAVVQDMSDAYDEGVRFVDEEIGALFEELKRRKLYDDALIVVTADHGEQFLEHGEIGHGTSLHDVLLRVPLIVKFPCPSDHCGARTIETPAQLVDVMPTILEVVGLEAPARLAGRSVLRPMDDERVLFAEKGAQVALRTRDFKYIYDLEDSSAELYALGSDPSERENLAAGDPDLALAFRDRALQWLEESERSAAAPREQRVADAAMLERLKALGYVR